MSNPSARTHNSLVHHFSVGDFECAVLAANIRSIPSPHPLFAPQATPEQFAEALARESLPPSPLQLYFNVLLVRNGHQNILIDAGFAKNAVPPAFNVANNLSLLGLTASDIDVVILSHAHGDHMGGLLDESGKQVFDRAQHFCSAEEIAFWTSPNPDFSESQLDEQSRTGSIAAARRVFESIPFTQITSTTTLPDGLTALLAPGHTPGHVNFRIRSNSEVLYHMMDLAHHFALMFPHPDWTVGFDVNSRLAAATRREIFPRLAAEGVRVFGYHLPFPALGHIQVSGDAFRWVPALWDAHL